MGSCAMNSEKKKKTSMDGSGNACHMSSNSMKYLPTYLHLCRSVETLDSGVACHRLSRI